MSEVPRADAVARAIAELPDIAHSARASRDPVEHVRAMPAGIARVLHRLAPRGHPAGAGAVSRKYQVTLSDPVGRAARAARRRRRRTADDARRSLRPKRSRARRRRRQGAPAAPGHSGGRRAAGRRARALASSPTAAMLAGALRCGAARRAAWPLLEGPRPGCRRTGGEEETLLETLCALAVWRAELDDAGVDAREELAFQLQLRELSHVLRAAGGGVSRAWKPGAMPDSWRED